MPGASGDLSLRTLVTYVGKMTLDDGRTVTELAGSTDQPTIASLGGTPRWRANANATYKAGPTPLRLTGRHVRGGNINHALTYTDIAVLEHSGTIHVALLWQIWIHDERARKVPL